MSGLEEDVLRLDVAVDHAVPVREGQCVQHLAQDSRGIGHGERTLAREPRAHRLAAHEGHHVIEDALGRAGRDDRHDVRVLQPSDQLDLAPEPVGAHARGGFGREDLDHDIAIERQVARDEDPGHPTAAQLALEAESVAERGLEDVTERLTQ